MRFRSTFRFLPIFIIGFSVLTCGAILFLIISLVLNPEIIGEFAGKIYNGFKEISQ
jgi:hypothetical protein